MFLNSGFELFGLHISFYGIIMAIAFLVAILLAIHNAKKRGLKSDDIITLAIYVIPLSILGARTYYCIFSNQTFTIGEFFAIWNGGLAVLGGVIGGLLAVILYSLIHKKNILQITDIVAPSLILGQAIGRIGCYFAGCCYGIESPESLQFFPMSVQIDGVWHLSTMFYESLWCLVCFFILLKIFKKYKNIGVTTCSYLCLYGLGRGIIETFRGDSLMFLGMKVSQILSAIILIIGIIGLILIYTKHKKNEKVNHS